MYKPYIAPMAETDLGCDAGLDSGRGARTRGEWVGTPSYLRGDRSLTKPPSILVFLQLYKSIHLNKS